MWANKKMFLNINIISSSQQYLGIYNLQFTFSFPKFVFCLTRIKYRIFKTFLNQKKKDFKYRVSSSEQQNDRKLTNGNDNNNDNND